MHALWAVACSWIACAVACQASTAWLLASPEIDMPHVVDNSHLTHMTIGHLDAVLTQTTVEQLSTKL
jgi:hypothetical protein